MAHKLVILAAIGLAALLGFFLLRVHTDNISQTSKQVVSNDESAVDLSAIYWDSYMAAVVAAKDQSFTNFVLFDLQAKCPFYKPDGTSYRDCLNRLIDKEISGFKGGSKTIETIKNDCGKESAQYIGDLTNTALSLSLSCEAYRLR